MVLSRPWRCSIFLVPFAPVSTSPVPLSVQRFRPRLCLQSMLCRLGSFSGSPLVLGIYPPCCHRGLSHYLLQTCGLKLHGLIRSFVERYPAVRKVLMAAPCSTESWPLPLLLSGLLSGTSVPDDVHFCRFSWVTVWSVSSLSSCFFIRSCHLQITAELLAKILGLTFNHWHYYFFEFALDSLYDIYFAVRSGHPLCPFTV